MQRTYESCAAVASKYQTKRDFRLNADLDHQWLRRNHLIGQACAHMEPIRRTLSDGDIARIAAKYTSRKALQTGDQSIYNAARRRGILDSVCAHMDVKHRDLSDEDIASIAKTFTSRSEFDLLDKGAYLTATKRGILDHVCSHMDSRGNRRLTDAEIIAIAKPHRTRRDFKLVDFGAYAAAWRRGLLEVACAHMVDGACGFNPKKPAVLYCIRFTKPCGEVLHKVGITNRSAKIRLQTLGLHPGVKASILREVRFQNGADARAREIAILAAVAEHRYQGEPIMESGNTELFGRDITNYL